MSTTFVARRKGSFASLIQSTSLGPYGLEARPPVTVRDLYVDTDEGELLQRGMRLLVRDVDDELTAHLIGVEDSESSRKWVGSLLQASLDPDRRVLTSAFELPRGDLQDALLEYVEGERLLPLLQLRLHQTRRIVWEDNRKVAALSFDVVVFEDPVEPIISNEAVFEISEAGTPEDVAAISGIFREVGLEVESRSKFERGVLRKARTLDESILLLPDERMALERIASEGAEVERRSARVVLMDSRGFRDMTIADETGFKTPTVRRLRHAFRQSRMGLFEYLLEEEPPASFQGTTPVVGFEEQGEQGMPAEDDQMGFEDGVVDAENEESFEDIDSLLGAFRPVETHTPRFSEPEKAKSEKEEALEDVRLDDQKPVSEEAAVRFREELGRLDRYALTARASKTDLEAVGGILYTAHRLLVLLDVFRPLMSFEDYESLCSPLERATHGADGVLDSYTAAESQKTSELAEQCDKAMEAFHAWLQGSESTEWRGRASRLVLRLENANVFDSGDHSSFEQLLVSTLRNRYDQMRTYAERLNGDEAGPSEFYDLATAAFGLQALLGMVEGGQATESLRERLHRAETTLARARHARVRAGLTGDASFLERGPNAETVQSAIDTLIGNELGEEVADAVARIHGVQGARV